MAHNRADDIIIQKVSGVVDTTITDKVAVEEPLQIELAYSSATGLMHKVVAVTMRTPGHDPELAAGFLFTEGIIQAKDIAHIDQGRDDNRILVSLHENIVPVLANAARNFYSTSSCGICGKASIDAIHSVSAYTHVQDDLRIEAPVLYSLPDILRAHQNVFEDTGGIHASGLFTPAGELIILREDVGRHNALDKLIGHAVLYGHFPLSHCILLLSGRVSFELVQKAAMAGIRCIAAVGAPSSLAVDMAKDNGISLVGFLRENRFNIYAGGERIVVKD